MSDPNDSVPRVPKQQWGKLGWVSQRPFLALGISLLVLGWFSLLIPVMRRGEETANLVQSNNFMKQIGLACQLYANDHGGQYPDTLGRLLLTEDIPADVFVSPQSDDTPARGPTTQAVVDELNKGGHSSYHYVGCGLTTAADPVTVVAYEDPAIFKRGGNVLYADGHVEFDDAATLMRIASGDYPASRPVTESSTSRP